MMRWNTEDFQSCEIILYDAVMRDPHHHTFVQAHGMHSTKSALWCKPGTLMKHQCRLITKCAPLVEDVDNGRGYAGVGVGSICKKPVPTKQKERKDWVQTEFCLVHCKDTLKMSQISQRNKKKKIDGQSWWYII